MFRGLGRQIKTKTLLRRIYGLRLLLFPNSISRDFIFTYRLMKILTSNNLNSAIPSDKFT